MAIKPIKTKILFPRADLTTWQSSTRVFKDGEIGIVKFDNNKFKLFAGIDGKTFNDGVNWLSADENLADYYTKSETSSAAQIEEAMSAYAAKQDINIDYHDTAIWLSAGSHVTSVDASEFIKDGMVDDVQLVDNALSIVFNTASGKEAISVDISKFIDTYEASNTKHGTVDVTVEGYKIGAEVKDNSLTPSKFSKRDVFIFDCNDFMPDPDYVVSDQTELRAAIAEAEDGETVALADNVTLTDDPIVCPENKEVTVDLAGNTITTNGLSNPTTSDTVFAVRRGGTLILDDTSDGKTGEVDGSKVGSIYCALKLTEKGEASTGTIAKIIVNGGKYAGTYYAVSGNGTRQNTELIIRDGVFTGKAVNDSFAVYQPQNGKLTITGGQFEGASAVFIKSGEVTINGGTFNAVGDAKAFVHNGNGGDPTGDAVMIESCDYPGGYPTVRINGGEFYSTNAKPVGVYAQSGHEAAKLTKFIYGGKFNKELDAELIADGYQQVLEDGMYVVKQI